MGQRRTAAFSAAVLRLPLGFNVVNNQHPEAF
jgi:hypothetical protein